MYALRIARALLYALAAIVVALAVVRFVQDVPDPEGGTCGPGWTTEYSGACDAALKARQYEAVTELVLASGLVVLSAQMLREQR